MFIAMLLYKLLLPTCPYNLNWIIYIIHIYLEGSWVDRTGTKFVIVEEQVFKISGWR